MVIGLVARGPKETESQISSQHESQYRQAPLQCLSAHIGTLYFNLQNHRKYSTTNWFGATSKDGPVARVQSVVYHYVSLPLHLFAYFGINTECSLSLI